MMNITTMSDSHGKHLSVDVGSGDMIIHGGDFTSRGRMEEIEIFLRWFGDLNFDHKILVPGNHDWDFQHLPKYYEELCANYGITCLNNSGIKINGLYIWGSPVTPEFFNWAFNRSRTEAGATPKHPFIGHDWDKIPKKTDILITHGPAGGILDLTTNGDRAGCGLLRQKIEEIKPVLHVCGHIHEGRGVFVDPNGPTTYVNASSLDHRYQPYLEKPFKFDWNGLITGSSKGHD
mgnify:CR=1 FL=1